MADTETEPFPDLPMTDPLPDENFNEPSFQRTRVLKKLEVILDDREVPVSFWAFCQVANVDVLEDLIRQFAAAPLLVPFAIQSCFVVPRVWAQKPPRFYDQLSVSSSSASSYSSGRSQRLAILTRERDGNKCVLTKTGPCDVAHIFAHSLIRPKKQQTASDKCIPSMWSVLSMFWSKDQVEKWKRTIFGVESNGLIGEDGVFNLLCLRPDLQRAWAQGSFGLRPLSLSDDETEMVLELQWLPRYKHTYDATIPIVAQPLSTRNQDSVDDCYMGRPSSGELEKLISGSIITLRTADPARLPLPSFALMEMAWHLARVVSMSASGLIQELDLRFEGDEDDRMGPMAVSQRVLDWIPSTETPASYASSATDDESPPTSANPSPAKIRTTTQSTNLGATTIKTSLANADPTHLPVRHPSQ
ncbi:hypothetical protein BDW59DRAFT_146282 [Aspergillus cavernicola]|uniref:HNH nuclease domain-containing protein n=1 Tax=Aspergillus cavernicola TaxID=176166 RepID=A0ABR4ICN6_9EURO